MKLKKYTLFRIKYFNHALFSSISLFIVFILFQSPAKMNLYIILTKANYLLSLVTSHSLFRYCFVFLCSLLLIPFDFPSHLYFTFLTSLLSILFSPLVIFHFWCFLSSSSPLPFVSFRLSCSLFNRLPSSLSLFVIFLRIRK